MPRKHVSAPTLTSASRALHTPVQDAERARWTAARRRAWDRRLTSPEAYFYDYVHPAFTATQARVKPEEHARFLAALRAWGAVALLLPGRTGAQCRRYFHRVGRAGFITFAGAVRRRLVARASVAADEDGSGKSRKGKKSGKLVSPNPVFLRRNVRKFVPKHVPKVDDKFLRPVDARFLQLSAGRKTGAETESKSDEEEEDRLPEPTPELVREHMSKLTYVPVLDQKGAVEPQEGPSTPTECSEHSDGSASSHVASESTSTRMSDFSGQVNRVTTDEKDKEAIQSVRSTGKREKNKKHPNKKARTNVRSVDKSPESAPRSAKISNRSEKPGHCVGTNKDISSNISRCTSTQSTPAEKEREKRRAQKEKQCKGDKGQKGMKRKASNKGGAGLREEEPELTRGEHAKRAKQGGCVEAGADSTPNRRSTDIDLGDGRDEREGSSCRRGAGVSEKRADPHKRPTCGQLELLAGRSRVAKRGRPGAPDDTAGRRDTTRRVAGAHACGMDSATQATHALNCTRIVAAGQSRDCAAPLQPPPPVECARGCDDVMRVAQPGAQFEPDERPAALTTPSQQRPVLSEAECAFDVADLVAAAAHDGGPDQDNAHGGEEEEEAAFLLDMISSDDETEGQGAASPVPRADEVDIEMEDVGGCAPAQRRIGAPSRAERASLSFLLCNDEEEGGGAEKVMAPAQPPRAEPIASTKSAPEVEPMERKAGQREAVLRATVRLFVQDVCALGRALGHGAERAAVEWEAGRRCDAVAQRERAAQGAGGGPAAEATRLWDDVGAWLAARMDEMEQRQAMGVDARARLATVLRL